MRKPWNLERTPKQPTALNLGDHVHIFGRNLIVVDVEDPRGMVTARDDERWYTRHVYFIEHKNLWRSRWMRKFK